MVWSPSGLNRLLIRIQEIGQQFRLSSLNRQYEEMKLSMPDLENKRLLRQIEVFGF